MHLCFFLSFQIASSLTKELCALVFGVNTFLGTILKTIITVIVADKRGLALNVHSQVCTFTLRHLVDVIEVLKSPQNSFRIIPFPYPSGTAST